MTPGIEAITTAALGLALDAASLRHKAIAANIANANTEGYVPMRVTFEEQLSDARESLQTRAAIAPFALTGLRAQIVPAIDVDGQGSRVQLDVEVAKMAENTVHYQALLKGLSRHFALLNSAISDGRK